MTPEEHRKARAAHENALYRKIWLRLAKDSLEKGESVKREFENLSMKWGVASIVPGLAGLALAILGWPYPAMACELPAILALYYSIDENKRKWERYQFWLRVRQQRLDYAEMYR